MSPLRTLSLLAATGALALAGCGSDDDSSTSTSAASTPAASTTTPAAASGDVAVSMKNIAFDPKSVTVKVGQKVTWTNDEGVQHNVVAEKGEDFKSDLLSEGQTFSYTFDKAGTVTYECTIHPGMEGTVVVE
jgi:amicyanin